MYYWRRCTKCKTNYGLNTLVCKKCYKETENKPEGSALLKFSNLILCEGEKRPFLELMNIDYPLDENVQNILKVKGCYDCNTNFYCANFGRVKDRDGKLFSCSKEDFEYCPCKQCCVRVKKFNANAERVTLPDA